MATLGVNIDHVATVRQARGGSVPEPWRAALEAKAGGADGITMHLREDRRHIQDLDFSEVRRKCDLPINMEMALHPEIIRIALRFCPEKVCIVPEKRQELTTEGGLDVRCREEILKKVIPRLRRKKIEVSLFIAPDPLQIRAAARVGTEVIEIHTGTYAHATGSGKKRELERIRESVGLARSLSLRVNAGHGLDYQNVRAVVAIPGIEELNIGHSIVSRAVFVGLRAAVKEMKALVKR